MKLFSGLITFLAASSAFGSQALRGLYPNTPCQNCFPGTSGPCKNPYNNVCYTYSYPGGPCPANTVECFPKAVYPECWDCQGGQQTGPCQDPIQFVCWAELPYGGCPTGTDYCCEKSLIFVNDNIFESIDTIPTPLDIVNWYSYGNPDTASANTPGGLENMNSGWIGLAVVDAPAGPSIVVIYDAPNDGTGGQVSSETKCVVGCSTDNQLIARKDDSTEVNLSGGILLGTHHWDPCCTDGFATKALKAGDKICITFKGGRVGVANGIRFYTGSSYTPVDVTPAGYSTNKDVKICIRLRGSCPAS